MVAIDLETQYPCRFPGCRALSQFYARDNRAEYGHLCLAHWRTLVPYDRLEEYQQTTWPHLRRDLAAWTEREWMDFSRILMGNDLRRDKRAARKIRMARKRHRGWA